MKKSLFGVIASVVAGTAIAAVGNPYTGQENREIKALLPQEIEGYLNGLGMGYAKAAELNQFPGPRHVLDLARELALTQEQTKRTQVIYETMKTRAVALGKQLVEKESELDRRFADGTIDAALLGLLVSEIGALEARIRQVHLKAHLEQQALLSGHQIRLYDELRGYGGAHGNKRGHSH